MQSSISTGLSASLSIISRSRPSALILTIKTARVFRPLLEPARYKGAYGGGGGGEEHFFCEGLGEGGGYRIAWVEEGQVLSARSLALLRPTIRTDGSQIWVSWNPRRKSDAVDELLRHDKPDNAIVVRANWSDNPWFPAVLEEERQLDLKLYPDRYHHIWEGEYARAFEGSYFSRQLADARAEGRIGVGAGDPLLPIRAPWGLGGSGATAGAMAEKYDMETCK